MLKDKRMVFLFKVVLMFIIYFVVSNLPPFGMITELGMKVLGAFIAIAYGWVCIDLFWTSLFGFVLLGLTGLFTPATAISAGFTNTTVQTIIIVSAFAAGLNQLGLGDVVTNFMLSRKIIVGRPWLLVVAFAILSIVLGIVGKSIVGLILLFAIAANIAHKCGYENKSPELSFLCCLIGYGVFLPQSYAPYLTVMLMFGGIYSNAMPGVVIPYGKFFIVGLGMSILYTVILILLAKYVFRLDLSKFVITEEMRKQYAEQKASKTGYAAFWGLMIYITLLILPQFVSTSIPVIAFINNIGLIGWTIIFITIFFLWRDENNNPALDLTKMFSQIPWLIVVLIAVTIPLGNAVGNANVGIMATLAGYFKPLMENLGVTGMYIFVFILLGVITQFAHNFVAAALFMPLFGSIGASIGANPIVLFFLMFTALSTSYATPAASMNTGFIFGSEHVSTKWAYIWGWILLIVVGVICIVGLPILNAVF